MGELQVFGLAAKAALAPESSAGSAGLESSRPRLSAILGALAAGGAKGRSEGKDSLAGCVEGKGDRRSPQEVSNRSAKADNDG